MTSTYGAPQHPQALFLGFEEDDPGLRAMSALVARAVRIDTTHGLRERFHVDEWDILVTRGREDDSWSLNAVPESMHVLSMGASATGWLGVEGQTSFEESFRYDGSQPSRHITLHDADVSDDLRRLVRDELVPWLLDRETRPYLKVSGTRGSFSVLSEHGPPIGFPLVSDVSGNVIAGVFARGAAGSAGGQCLILPFEPEAPERWLLATIDLWRIATPERFADMPTWRDNPRWQSVEEHAAVEGVAQVARKRAELERALAFEEREAEARLVAARTATDAGHRRLLTEQDVALVQAVADAFCVLGFNVVDADAETSEGTPKMEDLRLTDPDIDSWTNITEVKGYAGGGKTRDLQSIARFAAAFLRRNGSMPTSRWYVVNQFRDQDPDRRPQLLAGADEDVEGFSEDGGLAIDTRDLFELVRRVEEGTVEPRAVRALLRVATGRFVLPE